MYTIKRPWMLHFFPTFILLGILNLFNPEVTLMLHVLGRDSKCSTEFISDPDGNRYPIVDLLGKSWLAKNLNYKTQGSFCYGTNSLNCELYGRLYNWEAAKKACSSLGNGWRLPTDEDWIELVFTHGGYKDSFPSRHPVRDPQKAYYALIKGGVSGFDATPNGGWGEPNSIYFWNLEDFGIYWSASKSEQPSSNNWVYSFSFSSYAKEVSREKDFPESGFNSCRCLKDKSP